MLDYGVIIMMYLLTQLAPVNKNLTLTVSNDEISKKITFNYDTKTRQWLGKDDAETNVVSVDKKNRIFIFGSEKININDLIVDDAKINWKKVTSVNVPARGNGTKQSPIIIKRNQKSIQLSQKEGDMDKFKNITISW